MRLWTPNHPLNNFCNDPPFPLLLPLSPLSLSLSHPLLSLSLHFLLALSHCLLPSLSLSLSLSLSPPPPPPTPPQSSNPVLSGQKPYKTAKDFAGLEDYARYVRDNLRVGMLVKCKESYEEVKGGDVGRVLKVGGLVWEKAVWGQQWGSKCSVYEGSSVWEP